MFKNDEPSVHGGPGVQEGVLPALEDGSMASRKLSTPC